MFQTLELFRAIFPNLGKRRRGVLTAFPMIEKLMELPIQIDPHTLKRAEERGATESEIKEILLTGQKIPAKRNRKARAKVYSFGRERNGKFYEQKRIEVYYVEEAGRIITVTVYVFYGKWEGEPCK